MVQKTGSFSFLLCQRFLFETSIAIKPARTNHNSYPISQASNHDIYEITHISLLMFYTFFYLICHESCMRGRSDNYICNKTAPALKVHQWFCIRNWRFCQARWMFSFDKSLLNGEARRFSANFARSPSSEGPLNYKTI